MSITRHPLDGPTRGALVHREQIDWHDHARHQLIYPSRGVLQVSTAMGAWVVPPHRAVWIPATVAHAHRAHGPTEMLTLAFDAAGELDPLPSDRPTVLAVSPLLREVIIALTGQVARAAGPRRNLERVAVDQLRQVEALALSVPALADDRLRAISALLADDPADPRSLAELGTVVGASPRTLSRLFRAQAGMSFAQWRAQTRLHHSLRLLASGASVTATATACGYGSASAFIQAFRQAFGLTPAKYRKRSTDDDGPPVGP
ncbi:helix-turn-helix transcriptional regulator [Actinocrinis puniceicyclus]|uniref:HTH-type transcriptional regulator RipA n=1 Tax=Actinocrinis puniceicyclus TaxID=977794 RepID=A0A8J7WNL8_9ACTN|nr:helix-turn-helix transcriptional regulator [Actinocrinis puniceicyclus]MBS2965728.1 helix-turn-helix transcriptional regulator [Actinocrinis puniceicyclus]